MHAKKVSCNTAVIGLAIIFRLVFNWPNLLITVNIDLISDSDLSDIGIWSSVFEDFSHTTDTNPLKVIFEMVITEEKDFVHRSFLDSNNLKSLSRPDWFFDKREKLDSCCSIVYPLEINSS